MTDEEQQVRYALTNVPEPEFSPGYGADIAKRARVRRKQRRTIIGGVLAAAVIVAGVSVATAGSSPSQNSSVDAADQSDAPSAERDFEAQDLKGTWDVTLSSDTTTGLTMTFSTTRPNSTSATGDVTVTVGCVDYSGTYTANDGAIRFGTFVGPEPGCAEGPLPAVLSAARRVSAPDGQTRELLNVDNEVIAVLTRQNPEAQGLSVTNVGPEEVTALLDGTARWNADNMTLSYMPLNDYNNCPPTLAVSNADGVVHLTMRRVPNAICDFPLGGGVTITGLTEAPTELTVTEDGETRTVPVEQEQDPDAKNEPGNADVSERASRTLEAVGARQVVTSPGDNEQVNADITGEWRSAPFVAYVVPTSEIVDGSELMVVSRREVAGRDVTVLRGEDSVVDLYQFRDGSDTWLIASLTNDRIKSDDERTALLVSAIVLR